MAIELIDISIAGRPDGQSADRLPVTLVYADQADVSDATEWLEVRLISDASYARVLAEVERDALVRLREIVVERIRHLESLKGGGR